MLPENAIEVKNISKKFKVYYDKGTTLKEKVLFEKRRKYENRIVLKDISFQVKKGEAIGIIGHNGCGKSTTLKLLTRIMYPDSGSIEIKGRVSSLIELGAGFHPDMTGRENIYINAAIFGLTRKEIDNRLQNIIDFSELQEFIDNPVRTYSSGMYMRLAFSVAINVDADVLLIDEILGVGDANFQAKCFNKLKEIKANGTTIAIVSHSLNQIEQICERSLWIHDGMIREEGLPKEVHQHYLNYMMGKNKAEVEENTNIKKEGFIQYEYYDYVISLGYSCQVAYQMERMGLRTASLPFDWLFTVQTKIIVDALSNSFNDWLNKENLVEEISDTSHLKIVDKKYGAVHQHIFPADKPWEESYDEVKKIVDKRISRLLGLKNRKLLFVRFTTDCEPIEELERVLVNSFGENIRLLVLIPSKEFEIKKVNTELRFTEIYEIYHEREGKYADWRGYNLHYDLLFGKIRLNDWCVDLRENDLFIDFWQCEENKQRERFRWTKACSTLNLRKYAGNRCVITFSSPMENFVKIYDASENLLEEFIVNGSKEYSFNIVYATRYICIKTEMLWTPKEKYRIEDTRKLGVRIDRIHFRKGQ